MNLDTFRNTSIHGWLVLDKPVGITSAQAVSIVKRTLRVKKIGHAGTLDPLASGILPLALGEATKTVSYSMSSLKTYTFEVRWGEQRDTDDAEGKVIATSDYRPAFEEIQKILKNFIGVISQVPPQFSAIKVGGQRAYKCARYQKALVLAAREITIENFQLISLKDSHHAVFKVDCHKGTYVRSLARDLALALGTVGYVTSLRRNKAGPFNEMTAISLEKIKELGHKVLSTDVFHPIEVVLDDIPAIQLQAVEEKKLSQGQALRLALQDEQKFSEGTILCRSLKGHLIALATVRSGVIQPIRVFNI